MKFKSIRYIRGSRVAVALIVLAMGVFGYVTYRRFVITGLQAEAHLITSYIATLEAAYAIEHGRYVEFSPYGAEHLGRGQCQQPKGAEQLGFRINWCNGVSDTIPVRFFYEVALTGDPQSPVIISATSGSDALGQSFVCFGQGETDVWTKGIHGKIEHKQRCSQMSIEALSSSKNLD